MKIVLETEDRIRLLGDGDGDGDGFAFEAGAVGLSPFHLLAAGLATCTHSMLQGWARHADLSLEGLEIGVAWEIGGDPVRVTRMDMAIHWPGLAPERRAAAVRAASQCTIHNTLTHPTTLETRMAEEAAAG
ncbi:MAG TPA: OsmC family protein [Longimicrobiales bacterium]|nr:OsmC family protein [Longimicrobiales bacterium]